MEGFGTNVLDQIYYYHPTEKNKRIGKQAYIYAGDVWRISDEPHEISAKPYQPDGCLNIQIPKGLFENLKDVVLIKIEYVNTEKVKDIKNKISKQLNLSMDSFISSQDYRNIFQLSVNGDELKDDNANLEMLEKFKDSKDSVSLELKLNPCVRLNIFNYKIIWLSIVSQVTTINDLKTEILKVKNTKISKSSFVYLMFTHQLIEQEDS